jgi:hypothetical protein
MFALHETTRRRACRAAFVALCIAPTVATAGWIADHWRPGRQTALMRELSDRLEVNVELVGVAAPRPATVRTRAVNLCDPSSGALLGTAQGVHVQRTSRGQIVSINEGTITVVQLKWLAEELHEWAGKLPAGTHEVCVRKLLIRTGSSLSTNAATQASALCELRDVRMQMQRDASSQPRLGITAHMASSSGETLIQLTLTPAADGDKAAAMSLTLDSTAGWIPLPALVPVAPILAWYGADARFQGVLQWSWVDSQVRGTAHGTVEGIELAQLLPSNSPHVLRGAAMLELTEFSWNNDRLTRVIGALHAEQARISQSLVDALTSPQGFRCRQASDGVPIEGEPSIIGLDLLALQFQLTNEGLTFWGNCPDEAGTQDGCMAISGMQPLLLAAPLKNWPHGVLLQTLSGLPTSWIPATREAVELARRLPLPLK